MESISQQFNLKDIDFSALKKDEKLAEKAFLNLIDHLCYDKNSSISSKPSKLEILKRTLKVDLELLDSATHYDQITQQEQLNKLATKLEEASQPNSEVFHSELNLIINEQIARSIRLIGKLYEEKNEKLIEQFKKLLNKKYEDTQYKLSVVEKKLEKLTKPQDIAMQKGYSNIFSKIDKEGFAIPLPRNTNEKKRELKDQKSEQSSKRMELKKNSKKEDQVKNNEYSSSSTHEEQNNGYQSN